jgi:hypothetical protein
VAAPKKKQPNPLTPAGADAFAMYVAKWQEALNMNDWRIHRSSKPAAKANMAEVNTMDLGARMATYRLGADFGALAVTDDSLEDTALHEVLHVFLYPLIEAAKEHQTITEEALAGAEHSVIHTLVKLLVKS